MELYQLKYFLALSRTLDFARAAMLCSVTQPALTRDIQHLEAELGASLLRGDLDNIRLSDLGRSMRPHFERIVDDTEAARSTATAFLTLEDTPLALGMMASIGPLRAMGFLSEFSRANPGLKLSLREGTPERLTELLLDGTIACAILAQPEPFDPRLSGTPLYRERFVVAFPLGHRFQAQPFVAPADLKGESYLSRSDCEFRTELDAACRAEGFVLRETFRGAQADWLQVMVAAGMGVSLMPEYSPLLPGLQTRPLEHPRITREVSLVTVTGRPRARAVEIFANAAEAHEWGEEPPSVV
jgi:LysR family transcriptional regulator, hydrogen peroxide-inducible genes activator